jgi:hypothetical protein
MTAKEPTIFIDPVAGGRLTPEALLRSEGTVELRLFDDGWPSWDGVLFHIAFDDFWFGLGFRDGQLIMQRREFVLGVDETFLRSLPSVHTICASWTMERLTFLLGHIGFRGPSISRWVTLDDPRPAPASLIRWARRRNLVPTEEFESEHAFVERVHSSLSFLQDKIDEMASPEVFWDVVRDGQRIVRRTPKRETDLQSLIHALLSDQMLVAGIEVVPEYQTGAGRLDFMFMGRMRGGGIAKLCAEFKTAHSSDLLHGIRTQLPAYMRSTNVDHGTYCVLEFRGEWFDEPRTDDVTLTALLGRAAAEAGLSPKFPIKTHRFRLGKLPTASTR